VKAWPLFHQLIASAFAPANVEQVLGISRRNLEFVYGLNRRRDIPIADDKIEAKRVLSQAGIPVPATLTAVRGFFEIRAVTTWLSARGDAVIKPSRGRVGSGVMILRSPEDQQKSLDNTPKRLGRHLADILSGVYSGGEQDVALVEERLRPHPAMADLWDRDIVDIRVIVHCGRPAMAMLRVPTSLSGGRSNLHAGGLGLAIDLVTGLTRDGCWFGRRVSQHPDTGAALAGIVVPDWPKIMEISAAAGHATPLGYIGVDIALDANAGPVVLEINARPGLEIQNVNGRGLRTALDETVR